jgi:hypothetical protein
MVAIKNIIFSVALFSASVFAGPLERRQNPLCLLDPAVATAVTCVLGCITHITAPAALGTCALECVRGLANTELVSRFCSAYVSTNERRC